MDAATPVHPCFLYESFWCLLGFVVLAICGKKFRKFDGQIFIMYIGWYGLGRFFIEGLRVDSLVVGNVRISQLVAGICVVVSVILLLVIGGRVRRMGSDYQLYCNTEACKQMMAELKHPAKKLLPRWRWILQKSQRTKPLSRKKLPKQKQMLQKKTINDE